MSTNRPGGGPGSNGCASADALSPSIRSRAATAAWSRDSERCRPEAIIRSAPFAVPNASKTGVGILRPVRAHGTRAGAGLACQASSLRAACGGLSTIGRRGTGTEDARSWVCAAHGDFVARLGSSCPMARTCPSWPLPSCSSCSSRPVAVPRGWHPIRRIPLTRGEARGETAFILPPTRGKYP
jgi:hypothetical protein